MEKLTEKPKIQLSSSEDFAQPITARRYFSIAPEMFSGGIEKQHRAAMG